MNPSLRFFVYPARQALGGFARLGAALLTVSSAHAALYALNYTVLPTPIGAVYGSGASDVSGDSVVGALFSSPSGQEGFLYSGGSYTVLNAPLGLGRTYVECIDGDTVAGYYQDSSSLCHGFIYNHGVYTTFDKPQSRATYIKGISGNHIVGQYDDGLSRSFLYDGTSFTTLSDPFAVVNGTVAYAIDGNKVVGYYTDPGWKDHGFIYVDGVFTTLDNPLGTRGTVLQGISGNKIIGEYIDDSLHWHSFVYDGSDFTPLDDRFGLHGIDGNTIVGTIQDSSHTPHAFTGTLTPIPEPQALALGAVGVLTWAWFGCRAGLRTGSRWGKPK